MQELDFAMMDAKDRSGPVSFRYGNWDGQAANTHNANILAQAEAEYMNRLLALQKEIKEKYEPQCVENKPVGGEPEYGKGSPSDVYDEVSGQLLEKDTGNLWYS